MNVSNGKAGIGRPEAAASQGPVSNVPDVRAWQHELLRGVLRAAVIVGFLAVLAGSYDAYIYQSWWVIAMYWGAYGFVLLFLFWRRAPYVLQAWSIVALLYVVAVTDFVDDGTGGAARAFLLIMPFLAGIFLGRRASVFALALATLTMAGFGWAFSTGLLTAPENPSASEPGRWISGTLVQLFLGVLIVVCLNYLMPRFTASLDASRRLVQELAEQRELLEEQVAGRTDDLARRGAQLETAAQVARDAAAIRNVEVMLAETVRLISDRFGFYHTGIFMLDGLGEYAVLRAASSEGGQRMLAAGHRLRVGEVGLVGYVAQRGESRIALDVGQDAAYFDNPDLPQTRSEAALPLRVRGQVMGVLDVQSTEPDAFSQEDVAVLQTLADQIAVAISNARLFQQAQESLEAERRAYSELSLEGWQDLIRMQPGLERRYDPDGILPADKGWRDEMRQAVQEGRAVSGQDGVTAALAIPLCVRDQVIGVLDAHKPAGTGDWTDEELALLQTLVDQLAVALDSARLYQDAQRRAVEDRLVGEITAHMRETLDVDLVLQTAVKDMAKALSLPRVEVRLRKDMAGPKDVQQQGDSTQARDSSKENEHVSLA